MLHKKCTRANARDFLNPCWAWILMKKKTRLKNAGTQVLKDCYTIDAFALRNVQYFYVTFHFPISLTNPAFL
jgi:hypothetical protein